MHLRAIVPAVFVCLVGVFSADACSAESMCFAEGMLGYPTSDEAAQAPLKRVDPASGETRAQFPPDPIFNHEHFKLEIIMPDIAISRFWAQATLTLSPIADTQTRITLDAGKDLHILTATIDDQPIAFTHDHASQKLILALSSPLKPAQHAALSITYIYETNNTSSAKAPRSRRHSFTGGLLTSPDDPTTPIPDPAIHTQGQPESNHLWFPCHDFPNIRVPTEMIVTVPEGYVAVSNGKLLNTTSEPASRITALLNADQQPVFDPQIPLPPLHTFHYLQARPHPYYLVCLAIAQFDQIELGTSQLSIPIFGPTGSSDKMRTTFARLPEMVTLFEQKFGRAFPWDKAGIVLCRDFTDGGMENTSAIFLPENIIRYEDAAAADFPTRAEHTIAHELAHQWFGDLLTCRSWEHLWLNEGFACLGEGLWAEHLGGAQAYHKIVRRWYNSELRSKDRSAPSDEPMVSHFYTTPLQRFWSGDNVYTKGASILHMLRMHLGDEVFFAGVREYIHRFEFKQVETDDFRKVMEDVSGRSLEQFFDQWCLRPGYPRLDVDMVWEPAATRSEPGGVLRIRVRQRQPINPQNPAYTFTLEIARTDAASAPLESLMVPVSTSDNEARFELPERPHTLTVDPRLSILAKYNVRDRASITPAKQD